ncbi:MAG: TlpA family protein disulfide reductase, partial [Deltaproteobacteria bacterium]|nr:TlpA family protein disulfide reductase [Deltaproteobacteria bacterium]
MARPRSLLRGAVVLGALLILAAAVLRPGRVPPRREPPAPPRLVGPEGLELTDGPLLLDRISRTRARGVVVAAWASWCASCKADLPLVLGLRERFGGAIEVLLVSVDEPETRPRAAAMLAELGATDRGLVVEGRLGPFKAAMTPRWPGMLPATFLFDPRAQLRHWWGGPVLEDEIVPL